MIIVKDFPRVIPAQACPVVQAKIIGHNGRILRVKSIDYFTKKVIDEYTVNITSDPFEYNLTFPTGDTNEIIVGIITVEDSNGNVYEFYETHIIHIPDNEIRDLGEEYEIWYIAKNGFSVKVKDTRMYIPNDGICMIIAWKKGKLIVWDGTYKEYTGRSALLKLRFVVRRDLASVYANTIDDKDVTDIIYKVPDLAPIVGAIRLVKHIFEDRRFTPVAVSVEYDDNNVYIEVTTHVDLYSPIDLWGLIKILTGVGAIVAGAILLIASAGVSAPLSYAMFTVGAMSIACGLISIFDAKLQESPKQIVEYARSVAEEAKQKNRSTRQKLEDYLNQLVTEGKITEDEKNKILRYVDEIIATSEEAMDELVNSVDKAYKNGYNDGLEEGKKRAIVYSAIAGGVGFGIGVIAGKKV
ncbi:MAG: hypothetical protein DRJ40_11535 [Thermoprotei archaeon]|nr:MAG: hypothetical protein DRJ40_11535 [Thermoprotei archaeon]